MLAVIHGTLTMTHAAASFVAILALAERKNEDTFRVPKGSDPQYFCYGPCYGDSLVQVLTFANPLAKVISYWPQQLFAVTSNKPLRRVQVLELKMRLQGFQLKMKGKGTCCK